MTDPQTEPSSQALGESLAALAAQMAALRGQIAHVSDRLDRAGLHGDLDLAARIEELAQILVDALDAAARPRGSFLAWPEPAGLRCAARRAEALG